MSVSHVRVWYTIIKCNEPATDIFIGTGALYLIMKIDTSICVSSASVALDEITFNRVFSVQGTPLKGGFKIL